MPYEAICLSGLDGSQMRDVGREAAGRLGFTLVDEAASLVVRAAGR